jgi:Uncharacterised protein family (UPF0236)
VSPYLQELYVYGGQFDNYRTSSECLSKTLRICVNSSQMERLTQYYGGLLETALEASLTVASPLSKEPKKRGRKKKTVVISQLDELVAVSAEQPPVSDTFLLIEPSACASTDLDSTLSIVSGSSFAEKLVPPEMVSPVEVTEEKEPTEVQKAAESMRLGLKKGELVYVMVDGSMLPTREGADKNDWREVKLGRIFTQSSIHEVDKHHNWIRQSLYVARMDNCLLFIQVMVMALNAFKDLGSDLVFINDGACWIWKWIAKAYPQSTQIIDFYHVMEYLTQSAKILFKDKAEREVWIDKQEKSLKEDGVTLVIKELDDLMLTTKMTKTQKVELNKIKKYFNKHQQRMLYKTFTDRGLLIGSGPIESAHRVILQKRLKQSGQRWSKKGAQNVINLRIQHKNGLWNNVVKLIDTKPNMELAKAA